MKISPFLTIGHASWLGKIIGMMILASLLLTACGGGATATATPTTAPPPTPTIAPTPTPTTPPVIVNVKIVEKNEIYSFQSASLTIKAGTQVVWTNVSDASHTVTSDQAGIFGTTANLAEKQTFSFTFTT